MNYCMVGLVSRIWESMSERRGMQLGEGFEASSGGAFGRVALSRLRLRALRSGAWFRALRRIDRVLVDVTLIVSTEVHSTRLMKALSTVVSRLEEALGGSVLRAIAKVGFELARKVSLIGQRLGNVTARGWATDVCFARFLAVMSLNGSGDVKR